MFAVQVPLNEEEWIYVLDLFEVDQYKPTLYLTKEEAEKEASNAGWTNYRIVEYND